MRKKKWYFETLVGPSNLPTNYPWEKNWREKVVSMRSTRIIKTQRSPPIHFVWLSEFLWGEAQKERYLWSSGCKRSTKNIWGLAKFHLKPPSLLFPSYNTREISLTSWSISWICNPTIIVSTNSWPLIWEELSLTFKWRRRRKSRRRRRWRKSNDKLTMSFPFYSFHNRVPTKSQAKIHLKPPSLLFPSYNTREISLTSSTHLINMQHNHDRGNSFQEELSFFDSKGRRRRKSGKRRTRRPWWRKRAVIS